MSFQKEAQQDPMRGCLGGALTGLMGVGIGFIIGFLCIAVFIPFTHGEVGGWLFGMAVLTGFGGAMAGGPLGLITGMIAGPAGALKVFATKGLVGGALGVVAGFVGGFLLNDEGSWGLFTDCSFSGALLGLMGGIIAGTIRGCVMRRPRASASKSPVPLGQ